MNFPDYQSVKTSYPELKTILENIPELTEENIRLMFSCIDLTSLEVTDDTAKIRTMCEKVNVFNESFPDMPNVASVCVYPSLVEVVKTTFTNKKIGITSVAGGFPSSQTSIEVKELETEIAILDGATEIDIVISVGKFLAGKTREVSSEIHAIKSLMRKAHLKVILETGCLGSEEMIFKAAWLALESGADFIKTSTGKVNPAATPEAMYAMCIALSEFNKQNAQIRGIKPAGGISTSQDALIYLSILKAICGEAWLKPKHFRIGASRLANNLLSDLAALRGTEFKAYF
jgi:deoxyribose-phosphate aldolase